MGAGAQVRVYAYIYTCDTCTFACIWLPVYLATANSSVLEWVRVHIYTHEHTHECIYGYYLQLCVGVGLGVGACIHTNMRHLHICMPMTTCLKGYCQQLCVGEGEGTYVHPWLYVWLLFAAVHVWLWVHAYTRTCDTCAFVCIHVCIYGYC